MLQCAFRASFALVYTSSNRIYYNEITNSVLYNKVKSIQGAAYLQRMKRYIIFSAFVSYYAVAQQNDYGGGGRYDDYYTDGGGFGGQDYDNLYDNYATRQAGKKSVTGGGGGRFGWTNLLIATVGGYAAGAVIHTGKFKKKMKTKLKNTNGVQQQQQQAGPRLRFKRHQRVECNMGDGTWMKGTITQLWFEAAMGQWVPYAIKLDGGGETYAPVDHDQVIRAISKSGRGTAKQLI